MNHQSTAGDAVPHSAQEGERNSSEEQIQNIMNVKGKDKTERKMHLLNIGKGIFMQILAMKVKRLL